MSQVLVGVRRRVERAVADGAPEQLKQLLDTVVEQILVESRPCHPAVLRRARGSYAYRFAEASLYAYEPRHPVAEPLGHHSGMGTGELRPMRVGRR